MEFQVHKDQLSSFAREFWQLADAYRLFAFHGEMGAGKTTTITALCESKGVKEAMGSPTFSIINEYAYEEGGSLQKIYHIDLYRLKDEEEIIRAGVEDCFYSGAVCLVEWPEKAPQLFDENTVHIYLEPVSETERIIKIELPS
ncbi:MAG TPA: tRNA (adenosine(37)-N6)-threonylcarbamoyltransferase complex ATPase subunit type 1 TsaE [Flavisolibacter sp.]|jgi:tRNA threonylcarbamoyladenosine biosynthesis protein TsaE|nr:tRNA (adenosine(37)-N6)-threonylcarbamoyltransferase complex ATPase subunit type 1 TsaE [Flavisolibacter sp.]